MDAALLVGTSATGYRKRVDGARKKTAKPKAPSPSGVNVVRRVLLALGGLSIAGFLALIGTAAGTTGAAPALIGTGLLVELAGIAAGGFIGFLFAIPRSASARAAAEDAPPARPSLVANTNLIEISDWLTKILVGIGLIQLAQISGGFTALVDTVATDLGGGAGVASAIGAMVVFAVIAGFMAGYLVTRTSLTVAFQEYGDLASRVDQNSRAIDEHEIEIEQLIKDQRAINAVEALLGGATVPGGDGGFDARYLEDLSSSTRTRIFGRARRARRDNTLGGSARVERLNAVAVVFRALTVTDSQGQYHRNYGQLGYALKDLRPPQFDDALAALDEAIRIRDAQRVRGYRMYEFTRAVCKAGLDPAATGPSEAQYRDAVLSDLRASATDDRVRADDFALVKRNPWLSGFLTRNGLNLVDVTR